MDWYQATRTGLLSSYLCRFLEIRQLAVNYEHYFLPNRSIGGYRPD